MKKQLIPGCVLLALSLVITLGSISFLSPCVHEDGSFGTCHWAGRSCMGIGAVLGILAVMALLLRRGRRGVYLSALPACLLGILTPGTLISLCRMSSMRCRAVMQPALIILFAAAALAAAAGAICAKES